MIELSLSSPTEAEYSFSSFFIEQLQAFEVWLMFGIDKKYPPQQLPVLLQVLLSQVGLRLIRFNFLLIKYNSIINGSVI